MTTDEQAFDYHLKEALQALERIKAGNVKPTPPAPPPAQRLPEDGSQAYWEARNG